MGRCRGEARSCTTRPLGGKKWKTLAELSLLEVSCQRPVKSGTGYAAQQAFPDSKPKAFKPEGWGQAAAGFLMVGSLINNLLRGRGRASRGSAMGARGVCPVQGGRSNAVAPGFSAAAAAAAAAASTPSPPSQDLPGPGSEEGDGPAQGVCAQGSGSGTRVEVEGWAAPGRGEGAGGGGGGSTHAAVPDAEAGRGQHGEESPLRVGLDVDGRLGRAAHRAEQPLGPAAQEIHGPPTPRRPAAPSPVRPSHSAARGRTPASRTAAGGSGHLPAGRAGPPRCQAPRAPPR